MRAPVTVSLVAIALMVLLPTLTATGGGSSDYTVVSVTSFPPQKAAVGYAYIYRMGFNIDEVVLDLIESPDGMEVRGRGLFWVPRPGQEGNHTVIVSATDPYGNRATQTYLLEVLPYGHLDISVVIISPTEGLSIGDPKDTELSCIVSSVFDEVHLETFLDGESLSRDTVPGTGKWSRELPSDIGPGMHMLSIVVSSPDGKARDQEQVSFTVRPPATSVTTMTIASSFIAVSALLLLLVGLTDAGKYKFFLLVVLPLYSKIKKEAVLDQFTRGQVYQYVKANPGEIYTTIKNALKLNNGTLTYHLRFLEDRGLIHSARNGTFRHFYPKDVKIPNLILRFSKVQKGILDVLRENPGINQVDLSEEMGMRPSAINYHMMILQDIEVVQIVKRGKSTKCYLVPEAGEGGAEEPGADEAGVEE